MRAMKKNTKVSWQVLVPGADHLCPRGHGHTISDEANGQILVSVESLMGEPNPGYHQVINCTVTWLTEEP